MEKEEEQVLQHSGAIAMEELEEEMEELEEEEEVHELLEDEYDDEEATPEPPVDASACDRIEKMAAVVAWNPSAELFLNQLMLGDKQFEFMFPGNEHYAYYWHRIAVLGRRPRLLYS